MAKIKFSTKRLMINKANAQMIIITGIASTITVFSLVASRALLSQRSYQSTVISKKEDAVKQLKSNVTAVKTLESAYQQFVSSSENAVGGNPTGTGELDGDNAKIVLDALPSQYDFPALATSLEKLLSSPEYKIESIVGKDDELAQQDTANKPATQPVDIPFEITVTGSYDSIQKLVGTLQRSIRPFQALTMDFSSKSGSVELELSAKSFYQPEKSLTIKTEEVK